MMKLTAWRRSISLNLIRGGAPGINRLVCGGPKAQVLDIKQTTIAFREHQAQAQTVLYSHYKQPWQRTERVARSLSTLRFFNHSTFANWKGSNHENQ